MYFYLSISKSSFLPIIDIKFSGFLSPIEWMTALFDHAQFFAENVFSVKIWAATVSRNPIFFAGKYLIALILLRRF